VQVIATAGHVDHGKSTLVRALTGMEPDRWAEERRRGMTIDLGYAWTTLPSGQQIAFVDVPGHERFTTNMLAGVGPVPAVMLVIAADEGWCAQTDEHVRALHALGVRHGIVAVTRSDLADPVAAIEQAREELAATTLAGIPAVSVSGVTGAGVGVLRNALDDLARSLPLADPGERVRLWVDRSFTIRGSGTVVTGTLTAGTLRRGDTLELGDRTVTVRGLQRLGVPADEVGATARVAVNLRGIPHEDVRRGDALLTPAAWRRTAVLDARIDGLDVPTHVVVHIGATAVAARVRRLGGSAGPTLVRLLMDAALPLRVGDRLLLRDPGRHRIVGGATVLDPAPPSLRRRGAARARAEALADGPGFPDLRGELTRRGAASRTLLTTIGIPIPEPLPPEVVRAGRWLVDQTVWERWRRELVVTVTTPPTALVDAGWSHVELVRALQLPDVEVLAALLLASREVSDDRGKVRTRDTAPALRPDLDAAVARLAGALHSQPFAAPDRPQLATLGLGRRELGAAAAAGAILLLPGDIALLPAAAGEAASLLRALDQPFTLSAARQALGTTRRVAVPLLEHLDRIGLTERVDGDRRRVRAPAAVSG
jgi:selenocysteine-specific elongation factor